MTKKQKKVLIRIIITAILMIGLEFAPVEGYGRFALYLIPYGIIGYDILRKAFRGILNRQVFDENFLNGSSYRRRYGHWPVRYRRLRGSFSVMLLYQIGELFQSYAVGKSRKNISALMDIRPDYANIEEDGKLKKVDPDDVEVGTVIVVHPGEKVPLDGVITEGNSSLNTSALNRRKPLRKR